MIPHSKIILVKSGLDFPLPFWPIHALGRKGWDMLTFGLKQRNSQIITNNRR